MALARGSFVTLTIGTWTKDAMVGLASENERSLAVLFDGLAPLGSGFAVGFMALFKNDDGTYVDIVTHTPVIVTEKP